MSRATPGPTPTPDRCVSVSLSRFATFRAAFHSGPGNAYGRVLLIGPRVDRACAFHWHVSFFFSFYAILFRRGAGSDAARQQPLAIGLASLAGLLDRRRPVPRPLNNNNNNNNNNYTLQQHQSTYFCPRFLVVNRIVPPIVSVSVHALSLSLVVSLSLSISLSLSSFIIQSLFEPLPPPRPHPHSDGPSIKRRLGERERHLRHSVVLLFRFF